MFHIVHCLRFSLLAALKLTFGTGMSDQRFIDPVDLRVNSFGENRELRCTFNSEVSFLDTIGVNTQRTLSNSFHLRPQLLLVDVVHPSWWYGDINLDTVALDNHKDLLPWSQMNQEGMRQQYVLF